MIDEKVNGKNYTFDEQVKYEFERIKGDRKSQDAFFGKALSIQNKAWNEDFADGKLAIACEVLCLCCYCNPTKCERCQLTAANRRAHQEIALGLRNHKQKIEEDNYDDVVAFTKDEILAISTACQYIYDQSNDETLASVICKINKMIGG